MLCIALDTKEQQKKYLKQDEEHRYDDLFMDFSGKTYSSSITPIRTQMQMVKRKLRNLILGWCCLRSLVTY